MRHDGLMSRPRRLKLPDEVAARLALAPGERPLAWAAGRDGEWYVGTDRAVHVFDEGAFRKVGWEHVERADWRSDTAQLAIVESADWGEPERRTEITLSDPGRLLELLRERVTKTIVCTVYAPVRKRVGLSVVGRRSPVGDGPVSWSYLLAEGLDPADPLVAEVAARAMQQAESELAGL